MKDNTASIVTGRHSNGWGIKAKGDLFLKYIGNFDTYGKAIWYGDSEFGMGNYTVHAL